MKIQQWLFELLRKQSVTDGRKDGRTDGRTDNVKTVYPLQTKFAGGIKNKCVSGLKILGRVGTQIVLFDYIFSGFCYRKPPKNSKV